MKIPYVTQYCNLFLEWEKNGINVDNASESQLRELRELRAKALEQSGLTLNELTLIMQCRNYRIFTKVNLHVIKLLETL